MDNYKDTEIRKKTIIKMIRNLLVFIVLVIFTFWFLFKDQDLNELLNSLETADKRFIFIGFLFMFLSYLIEAINVRSLLVSLGEKKISIISALKYTAIGAFFSAITPGSTGGQPLEMYYMSKDNINPTSSGLALLIELCGFQISTIFLAIICGIFYNSILTGGFFYIYLLGIVVNSFALICMLLAMFSHKLAHKFSKIILKIMEKLKVKNYEDKKIKIDALMNQYVESSKFIKHNKRVFIKGILMVFVQIFFFFSIPFFIYKSFGLSKLNFIELFAMQSVLYKATTSIPMPGCIGISEALFIALYGSAFGETLLSGAMLLFRFVSFYVYIIIFSFVVLINGVRTKNVEGIIDKEMKNND